MRAMYTGLFHNAVFRIKHQCNDSFVLTEHWQFQAFTRFALTAKGKLLVHKTAVEQADSFYCHTIRFFFAFIILLR